MFSWGSKKTKPALLGDTQRAKEMGEKAGADMASDFNLIIEVRFKPVVERYLSVLRDCLHGSFNNPDAPPIWLTRVHYASFVENVGKLKTDMAAEIYERMGEWVHFANEVGVREQFDEGVAKRVDDFVSDLTARGMKMVADYGEGLLEADKSWRSAHPEKALHFPMKD